MAIPRKQYVLARTRGRRTHYFYGTKLGALVVQHVKVGDEFKYAEQFTRNWRSGKRTSERTYGTER
jgi:hypothetical protein